ncbi:flagellar export chaperone FliS [Microbulbifer harenosus]|uniref:Flagellar secretion chaperone FliS n=1 Tax=Microbulbifer harenosus TaxID=2576840 RepID=A0ABY2UN28_9GAMM|nr:MULTISPECIES: flagellar export chaperone FliS [Microbulbifer]QIL89882.1 flagellar export chaperone FliS [Microbulbifer sp. SH-1]TLM79984.1 flagellar export chaperone FliS [Microbulbifer harenosus]
MYSKRSPGRAQGAASYAKVGLESDVLSASPHRLILLLFQGADTAIGAALVYMQDGNAAEKGRAISRALDIVNNGLAAALDLEQGGQLAVQMASLYDYIARQLLNANLKNDSTPLLEARKLLEDLASAWREVDPGRQHS